MSKIEWCNFWIAFAKAFLTCILAVAAILVGYALYMAWCDLHWWLIAAIGVFSGLVYVFYKKEK